MAVDSTMYLQNKVQKQSIQMSQIAFTPHLSNVATEIMLSRASSAADEQSFGFAISTVSKRKTYLDSPNLEDCIFATAITTLYDENLLFTYFIYMMG